MCGIFGSDSFERFKTLYRLNQSRGDFAHGMLGLARAGDDLLIKGSGLADTKKLFTTEEYTYFRHEPIPPPSKFKYFLGHTQAPTSTVREFNEETTHPFQLKRWCVAHNGVLSNTKELQKKYMLRESKVDTEVIASMLDYTEIKTGNPEKDDLRSLKKTFEELRGTFGCWVYNIETKNTYLIRVGSTLNGDPNSGDFTSAMDYDKKYKPLTEGVIYQIRDGIRDVGHFDHNSPYFIL